MKALLFSILLIVGTGVVFNCAAPTPLPKQNSSGAKLYAAKCGLCHSIPHPRRHDFKEWQQTVFIMEKQMARIKLPPLQDHEKSAILGYLKTYGR